MPSQANLEQVRPGYFRFGQDRYGYFRLSQVRSHYDINLG
jgi:hypothetical protein